MRISDWSSDVCSSDLLVACRRAHDREPGRLQHARGRNARTATAARRSRSTDTDTVGTTMEPENPVSPAPPAPENPPAAIDTTEADKLKTQLAALAEQVLDRKSTRLNSSH